MKIGIIGSGNMGRSLGLLWAEQGHKVFFGARTVEKGQVVAEFAQHGTKGGTNDEAAAFGNVAVLSSWSRSNSSGKFQICCSEIPKGTPKENI